MRTEEITNKIEKILAYERTIESLKNEVDGLKDAIREELHNRDVSELVVGIYVVRNTPVTSNRFDTKRFKEEFGADAYNEYCKEVFSTRFSIS